MPALSLESIVAVSGRDGGTGDGVVRTKFETASQTLNEEGQRDYTWNCGLISISGSHAADRTVSPEQGAQAVLFRSMVPACLCLPGINLFHSVQAPRVKAWLNLFDHCAIYLLIAAPYTPFLIVGLNDLTGRVPFSLIRVLPWRGIYLKLRFRGITAFT